MDAESNDEEFDLRQCRTAAESSWPDPVMNFLIAYDIADSKRLRQVAKLLEQRGRRVQYSVFLFSGTRRELDGVLRGLMQEIEPSIDRIQAWPIRTSTRSCRVDVGAALSESGVALIVSQTDWMLIEAIDDVHDSDYQTLIDI